jgi:uncharacterized protein (TIGR03437 family)
VVACAVVASAQLVTTTTTIPRTGKPPVVFLNGFQSGCPGGESFAGSFGQFDSILQGDGRVTLFFNNCEQGRNQPIEDLGATLGRYLDGLRYADGTPVPQVDVFAHSMGGQIVRAYLTGKQRERGEFRPPAEVKIRKALFVAVPFFGGILTEALSPTSTEPQVEQLRPGSAFVYDLATWNQGTDNLRDIDALAVVADGGSGIVSGNGPRSDDSSVSVTSASLEFARPGRTRVVDYCHLRLSGLGQVACLSQTPVAQASDTQHDTARILLSFLNETNEWQTVGRSPSEQPRLSTVGGIVAELRDAQDRPVPIQSATGPVRVRDERVWSENIPAAAPAQVSLTTATGTGRTELAATAGTTRTYRMVESAPSITAAVPSPSRDVPRIVAPGMFVTIYGLRLSATTEQAGGQPYPAALGGTEVLVNGERVGLHYVSPSQINVLMPDNISSIVKLTVRNPMGQHTVNVLVEPSVPAIFAALPNTARRGEYISLYLTGLGRTERRSDGLEWAAAMPEVSVGGRPCAVQYAGRAPGFAGLDQINCLIAADAATGGAVTAAVTVGKRTGTVSLGVQ